ncbi:hypothetical protein M569_15498, partial [Genlisea aurea]
MWLLLNPIPAAFSTCRFEPLTAAPIRSGSSRKIRSVPPSAAVAVNQSSQVSLHRLHSLVQVLKSREPAESVERLKWVDTLQRLGVDRYVQLEIDALLRD